MPGKRKVSNCLTKSDLQKIQAQKNWRMDINKKIKFYNFWVKRLFAKIFKNVKAMD